jgi:hypothetical protein
MAQIKMEGDSGAEVTAVQTLRDSRRWQTFREASGLRRLTAAFEGHKRLNIFD